MESSIVSFESKFDLVKTIMAKSSRELMAYVSNSFKKEIKYVSCLNVVSFLHEFQSYEHMLLKIRSEPEPEFIVVNVFSKVNYKLALDKSALAFASLTENERSSAINYLINKELDLLREKGVIGSGVSNSVVNESSSALLFEVDDSINNRDNFERLAQYLRENKSFGSRVSISKRKVSASWDFSYVHIDGPTPKYGINVFMDVRDAKPCLASVELVFKGAKSQVDEFDSFLEKANDYADTSTVDSSVKDLVVQYETPKNKNYSGQMKRNLVFFQTPQGSLYSVGTVLDGVKCTQSALHKNWMSLKDVEQSVYDILKIVEFVLNV